MPLQRDFRGLPDHTGNYSGGRQPFELGQLITPVLSAEDFINEFKTVRITAALTAVGQIATLPAVPEGEIHRFRYLGCDYINAGGASNAMQPVGNLDGIAFSGLRNTLSPATGATFRGYDGVMFTPDYLVVRAGGQMGFAVAVILAGTINIDVVGQFQVIRI